MATPVKRCLYIGLGGTGQTVLNATKRRLVDLYGSVPPMIGFVSIDIAPLTNPQKAALDSHEFIHLTIEDALAVSDGNRALYEPWLDYSKIDFSRLRAIDEGARQIRQLGRFVWVNNADIVEESIRGRLDAISSPRIADDPRWEVSGDKVHICFFSSMAGGTGSGLLLDLAGMVNRIEPSAPKSAYIMLPDVYRGLPNTHYVEENSYAFLKELDYLLSQAEEVLNGPQRSLFEVRIGGQEPYHLTRLFTRVVLISNASKHFVYPDAAGLASAIALAMFFDSGHPIGASADEVAVNPSNHGQPWEGGKLCLYSGLGVAEAYYPSKTYVEYSQAFLVSELLGRLDSGGGTPVEGVDAEASASLDSATRAKDGFVLDEGIRQRGQEHNEIGESLLERVSLRAEVQATGKIDVAAVERIWDRNEQLIMEHGEKIRAKATEARKSLTATKLDALERVVAAHVSERGPEFALQFLERLTGELEAVQSEFKVKAAEARAALARFQKGLADLRPEAREAAGRLWGRAKVEQALEGLRANVARIGAEQLACARSEEGDAFCAAMLRGADSLLRDISAYTVNCKSLQAMAEAEKTRVEMGLAHPEPFEYIIVPPTSLLREKASQVSVPDFLQWLEEHGTGLLELFSESADTVNARLREYVREAGLLDSFQRMSVYDIISNWPQPELERLVGRLDEMAAPLLDWQPGCQHADYLPQQKTTDIYLIGGTEEFVSKMRDAWVTLLGSPQNTSFVQIEDKNRIYIYKVQGCVPAYAMRGFETYRAEYERVRQLGLKHPLHLDRRWEAVLPDLGPEGADRQLWVWAIAASTVPYLRRVIQKGSSYSFEHFETTKVVSARGEEIQLGQGRKEARGSFLRNDALVQEARLHIERQFAEKGYAQVLDDLKAYAGELAERFASDSQIAPLVDEERRAIDEYLASAQS